jgi:predicted XRE-type DNA-binding protein
MAKSKKAVGKSSKVKLTRGGGNIFKNLGFSDEDAASMHARGQLAIEIRKIIEANGWSQRKAAKEMGIAQSRVAEIIKMRVEHFTIDTLIRYIGKLHHKVSVVVEPEDDVA